MAANNFFRHVLSPMLYAPNSEKLIEWMKSERLTIHSRIKQCGNLMVYGICNKLGMALLEL